ncbi:PKD domain-containing protein [Nocardioides sp. Iso805N]|uniref:PKD domain-containing protein n=1 Tax=Nocardioides sp. Iso805N TaxID=1283287 RepID=UPI00036D317C|nr:tannase/feruloyl esterase family alpha/beta hydrolase [Nocardioides sp. Iso805N]
MTTLTASIDCESYRVTDQHFGAPYIDLDEERETPVPHRQIHGGFADCDTRFTFYFPPKDQWQGRLVMPMEGAHAGHEDFFGGALGEAMGGLPLTARVGGYMVETNMGHIGDDIDAKGGEDATLYGWRAAVEGARFSKYVARQVYGVEPHHSYVWGGSGGGRRSPLVLENAPDVFDGAMPFMGGGDVRPFPATERIKGAQVMSFACMFNVQRLLRDPGTASRLIDAMQPGGTGNPFEGLDTHQAEELASLYRQGFPHGNEFMIFTPMGQIWLWSSIADLLVEQDPTYFDDFWTKPGYIGHDLPTAVERDVIDVRTTVSRVVTVRDLLTDPAFEAPEYMMTKTMAGLMAGEAGMDMAYAIEVKGLPEGYRLGAGLQLTSGEAAGRQLYAISTVGDLFACDGHGEANLKRFEGVKAGDEIHVDNRKFLAFCYFHRHHLMEDAQFDSLRHDGQAIYRQHPVPLMSPLMGVSYTGHYAGKLLWMQHTHDSSLWPGQGLIYRDAVMATGGPDFAADHYRLQWTQNAEHIPPSYLPNGPTRATATWLIDYFPIIEQGLADLISWTEGGEAPSNTAFEWVDGQVKLPASASARGGIQPVVSVTADGGVRTHVAAGDQVQLVVDTEVPPHAGTIVSVEWDWDGSGSFPFQHEVTGRDTALTLQASHVYDTSGTYFVTARVRSQRDGDASQVHRLITNVASARIVVS